ncbi:MAG: VPLPA-CTERM sorting domain-containing protein [Candidatus Thiodiazotropha sp. (ex Epidulcina cf. delphinae)]|nr:VPLPA-CTERM sorting domain-containing protein [Candidatus Thiodiazotropha sp. (ex Epidulcina cf. delphinae)]
MFFSLSRYLFASVLFLSLSAQAASISYEGMIGSGGDPRGSVSGSVGGYGWFEDVASQVDFWRFDVGSSGAKVDIWATRSDQALDPAFSLYSGMTSVDESALDGSADFGGMVFLGWADDEIDVVGDGPFGDPGVTAFLAEGIYTLIIGGSESDEDGPFGYELHIGDWGTAPADLPDVISTVPVPAAIWLFGSGLAGLLLAGRRKG